MLPSLPLLASLIRATSSGVVGKERSYYTCQEERENTTEGIEETKEVMDAGGGDHLSGDGSANRS